MEDERIKDIRDNFVEDRDIVDKFKQVKEQEVPKEQTGHGITLNFEAIDVTSFDYLRDSSYMLANKVIKDERIRENDEEITCYVSVDVDKGEYNIYYLTPKKDRHEKIKKGGY